MTPVQLRDVFGKRWQWQSPLKSAAAQTALSRVLRTGGGLNETAAFGEQLREPVILYGTGAAGVIKIYKSQYLQTILMSCLFLLYIFLIPNLSHRRQFRDAFLHFCCTEYKDDLKCLYREIPLQ